MYYIRECVLYLPQSFHSHIFFLSRFPCFKFLSCIYAYDSLEKNALILYDHPYYKQFLLFCFLFCTIITLFSFNYCLRSDKVFEFMEHRGSFLLSISYCGVCAFCFFVSRSLFEMMV